MAQRNYHQCIPVQLKATERDTSSFQMQIPVNKIIDWLQSNVPVFLVARFAAIRIRSRHYGQVFKHLRDLDETLEEVKEEVIAYQ